MASQLLVARMSKCATDYARVVCNPFGYSGELPCIPDFNIYPSNKICTKTRFTMLTGGVGSGCGFVLVNPQTGYFNNLTGASTFVDAQCMFTDNTYANTGITFTIAAGAPTTTGVFTANSNSPYASTSNNSWRTVACGLKIQYTGTHFRDQGTVYLFRLDSGHTINSGTTGATLAQNNYTIRKPVSRQIEFVVYSPSSSLDSSYRARGSILPSLTLVPNWNMGVLIEGGDTSTPQSWMVEVVSYYESTGPGLPLSPSHSDPTGYGSVLAALPTVNPSSSPTQFLRSVLSKAQQQLVDTTSHVLQTKVIPGMANMAIGAVSAGVNKLLYQGNPADMPD